jgi:hypothetical protein
MSTPVVDVSPASNPGLTDKPDEVTKSYIMQQAVGFSFSLSLSLSLSGRLVLPFSVETLWYTQKCAELGYPYILGSCGVHY